MRRFLYFIPVFLLGIILLMPKEQLYYGAEEALSSAHLYLNDEEIHDRIVYFEVNNPLLLMDNTPIGRIESIRFIPLIVFNRMVISKVDFSGEFSFLFPEGIDHITLTYTLLHPLTVSIEGVGGFGPVEGEIDLESQQIKLRFEPSQEMRQYPVLLAKLRHSEKGLVYETSF
ncbi:MAG: hypothetical protein PHW64_03950 [Sulfuricurvum sp.]|nr:hypothetical protein [Sulfuricurvum sp.]